MELQLNPRIPAHVNAIQNLRWYLWEREPIETRDTYDIDGLLEREHELRKNAQQEITCRNRITQWEILEDETSFEECSKIVKKYRQRLKGLEWHYKLLKREWNEIIDSFTQGPLTQGMKLWRSHPNWFMHKILREDCVNRGGCCGRSCGCCFHRETVLPHREHAAGHCTVACDCCARCHGFRFNNNAKRRMERRIDHHTTYFAQIRDASLLGTLRGSHENPFDLIDQSVSYGRMDIFA